MRLICPNNNRAVLLRQSRDVLGLPRPEPAQLLFANIETITTQLQRYKDDNEAKRTAGVGEYGGCIYIYDLLAAITSVY